MIGMSMRELKRLKVLKEAIDGHVMQKVAAGVLSISRGACLPTGKFPIMPKKGVIFYRKHRGS